MDIALVEMLLVFGIVLGVALWQIISVRREIREDERRRQAASANVSPSHAANAPKGAAQDSARSE